MRIYPKLYLKKYYLLYILRLIDQVQLVKLEETLTIVGAVELVLETGKVLSYNLISFTE